MTDFSVTAIDTLNDALNDKSFNDADDISAALDIVQATLRTTDEFAEVAMSLSDKQLRVTLDRAPESVEGFEGQSERVYVLYNIEQHYGKIVPMYQSSGDIK